MSGSDTAKDTSDTARDNVENYKGLFDGGLGFGQKSAVIVVDFTKAYTTPGSKCYCPGKGYGVVDAVAESKPLLALARSKGVPIFYTVVYYEHPTDGGVFTQKIPMLRTWTKDNPLVEIDESIAPEPGDSVLVKQYPSAFFGTNLCCNLRAINVDTCIVIGCSTSGCIRATVLDGMQQGFRCIVPRQCVGDRTQSIHESNLFDMNAKNGDVLPKAAVMDYLGSLMAAPGVSVHTDGPAAKKPKTAGGVTAVVNTSENNGNTGNTLADNAANYKGVFDGGLGFGSKAAVIVVDFTKAYTTPGSKWYCPGQGFGVVDAVAETVPLLNLARSKNVPVFYTTVYFEHHTDGGIFTQKIPLLRTWTKDNPLVQIDDSIAPEAGDSVFVKQYPSAFFGTNLACNLRAISVDTCIVVGCSTSGCIRATVLEGMQHGFRCIVPRECVGDRTESIHESNLFDMNAKNGDVVSKSKVMGYLETL